jgi:signal peptidase I
VTRRLPRIHNVQGQIAVLVWLQRIAVVVAALITTVVAASLALVLIGVHDGYQAVAMQTGSMSPAIKPGDLAVLHRTDPKDIRVGDAITFVAPVNGSPMVTHRVVSIANGPGGPSFHTKGDANQSVDPWVVHYSSTGWKVTTVLGGVGAFFDFLSGAGGRIVVAVLVFALVFALVTAPAALRARKAATVATAEGVA